MVAPRVVVRVLSCALLGAAAVPAMGQAIGPDIISSSVNDVARNGVSGAFTAYSIGAVTCNRGDLGAVVRQAAPAINSLVGQNIFRYKSYGEFSRMEQVGQGWAKHVLGPISATISSCGPTCTNGGGGPPGAAMLGVNCGDPYSSGFNSQGVLGPRSGINAATGTFTVPGGGSTGFGNLSGKIIVPTVDVMAQPAGTRFFAETVHLLPDDAMYVRPGQSVAINALNNAASQEFNINGGTSAPSLLGAVTTQTPAIQRWKDIDPSVALIFADHDDTPNPRRAGTFIRSRFFLAGKATRLSSGQWRYEYAVYNLNSDRAAGSFTIPVASTSVVRDFSFRHAFSHSGEPYSNEAWTMQRSGDTLSFACQPYSVNVNANAVRWGTMYNFGFTCDAAPAPIAGAGSLGLFKPGAVGSIAFSGLPTPTVPPICPLDFNQDRVLNPDDIADFVSGYFTSPPDGRCDFDRNGVVDPDDLSSYVSAYFTAGCP